MNNLGTVQPPGVKQPAQNSVSPFARALASSELEKSTYPNNSQSANSNNLFSEALARTGGNIPQDFGQMDFEQQQLDFIEQQKKEKLRRELHDKVNPVELHDVFKASHERTKKELEEVRRELHLLMGEIKKFYKEVDVAVSQQITDQGDEGAGLKSYFQKLRAVIMLLRQKVSSARTWQQQAQSKSAKQKSRKIRGGLMMENGGAQETKTVWDMMHHERSTAYSGG